MQLIKRKVKFYTNKEIKQLEKFKELVTNLGFYSKSITLQQQFSLSKDNPDDIIGNLLYPFESTFDTMIKEINTISNDLNIQALNILYKDFVSNFTKIYRSEQVEFSNYISILFKEFSRFINLYIEIVLAKQEDEILGAPLKTLEDYNIIKEIVKNIVYLLEMHNDEPKLKFTKLITFKQNYKKFTKYEV